MAKAIKICNKLMKKGKPFACVLSKDHEGKHDFAFNGKGKKRPTGNKKLRELAELAKGQTAKLNEAIIDPILAKAVEKHKAELAKLEKKTK